MAAAGSTFGGVVTNTAQTFTGKKTIDINIVGGATGSIPYQTGPNETSLLAVGATGTVLTSGASVPTWTALPTTIATATNLAGGVASQIPYQSSAGTTDFIANGTSGQLLASNGSSAPSFQSLPFLSVAFIYSTVFQTFVINNFVPSSVSNPPNTTIQSSGTWTLATNGYKAPITGRYVLSFSGLSTGVVTYYLRLAKNGTAGVVNSGTLLAIVSAVSVQATQISSPIYLLDTDYIGIQIGVGSTAANCQYWFNISYLGA